MSRLTCAAVLFCGASSLLSAQAAPPAIGQNGVVNAASRIAPTLPGGDLAPGALFSISGVRLGSPGHTTVTISGSEAHLITITPERIDAILPDLVPPGQTSLVVKVDGRESLPFPVRIAMSNPGLFARNRRGWGPGAIDNLGSRGERRANSIDDSARPGQSVVLAATGVGVSRQVTVVIGNSAIKAVASQADVRPGEHEIRVAIPARVAQGCHVPVYLMATSSRASNVVTMAIREGGGRCEPSVVPLLAGSRIGVVVMSRSIIRARRSERDSKNDDVVAAFAARTPEPVLSPLLLLPPEGTCTAYSGSIQEDTVLPGSITDALLEELEGRGLDAGAVLNAAGAKGSRSVPHQRGVPGFYRARVGTDSGGRGNQPPFFDPGEFTLSASGGKDIGAFTVRLTAPSPFEWINREETREIDRSRPVVLRWSGSPAGAIAIVATNVDQISTAVGTALCVAPASAGQFTIPAALLANIPASLEIPGIPYDQLFVGLFPPGMPPRIPAAGLDDTAVISMYGFARFVQFR